MRPTAMIAGAGSIACAGVAAGDVMVTEARHYAYAYVESNPDVWEQVTLDESQFGAFMGGVDLDIGDPIAAHGIATIDSTVTQNGSEIAGVLAADSFVSVSDAQAGINFTTAADTISFTLSSPLDLVADLDLMLADEDPSFAYFSLQVFDEDAGEEVFFTDLWGEQDLSMQQVVPLVPGSYSVGLAVSAESELSDPPLGEYAAHSEVSYDVTFVPAPGVPVLVGLCAGVAWRRRR